MIGYGPIGGGSNPFGNSKIQYMVAVAQLVERRFVEPEAAGAEPVSHPKIGYPACSVRGYKININ